MNNFRKLKAILWDVDGVFVDTEKLHFKAWNGALRPFGKSLTLQEYISLIGRGGKENAETICVLKKISCDQDKFRADRRTIYKELRKKGIPIFKENIEFIKNFVAEFPQIRHAVVSSEYQAEIKENLRAAGIDNFFELIVSYEDRPDFKRKPEPDLYLYALEKLGLHAEECIVFEDSMSGIKAAKTAGIICVALSNEMTIKQDLSEADFIVSPRAERSPIQILNKLGF